MMLTRYCFQYKKSWCKVATYPNSITQVCYDDGVYTTFWRRFGSCPKDPTTDSAIVSVKLMINWHGADALSCVESPTTRLGNTETWRSVMNPPVLRWWFTSWVLPAVENQPIPFWDLESSNLKPWSKMGETAGVYLHSEEAMVLDFRFARGRNLLDCVKKSGKKKHVQIL